MLLFVVQIFVFVCQIVWANINKLLIVRTNSIMLAYASMLEARLEVTYYAQNYASVIRQWLIGQSISHIANAYPPPKLRSNG